MNRIPKNNNKNPLTRKIIQNLYTTRIIVSKYKQHGMTKKASKIMENRDKKQIYFL